ncbi:hypothetical protein BH09MYX1_BH09MYX1_22450 [soil metagenome]
MTTSSPAVPQPSIDLEDSETSKKPKKEPPSRPELRKRLLRWAIRGAIALVALWAIYLVAANLVGRSDWLQHKLNADPQNSQITFDYFWTVIPGNFHLENLHATFQYQSGTQVHVDGDTVAIDFAIFPLVAKHVVAERLAIDGFVFHERDVTLPAPGNPDIASTVELDVSKAPPALWYDEAKAGILIQIDDLEITHARDLWFYVFRYQGDAEMHGAITLRPNRVFHFEDLRFDLGVGTGQLMGKPAMRELHGRIQGTMESIEPAQLHDVLVLHSLSVAVKLSTELEDLEFLNTVVDNPAVILGGSGGHIGLDLTMDHGKVVAPGLARVDVRSLWINAGGIAVNSNVHVDGHVVHEKGDSVISLMTTLDGTSLRDTKMEPLAIANGTGLFAKIHDVDFAAVKKITLNWDLSAPDVRIDEVQRLNPLLAPHDVGFTAGKLVVKVDAHGALPQSSLNGHFWATSDLISFVVNRETTYVAKLSAGGDFSRANGDADLDLAHVFANLDNGAVRNGQATTIPAWWAHIDVPTAKVRAKDSAIVATVHVKLRDLDPVFTSIDALHGIPTWIHHAASLTPWNVDLHGTFGQKIQLDSLEAVAGNPPDAKARVRLHYTNVPKEERMLVAIDLGVLAVGVEKNGSSVSVILSDVQGWYDKAVAKKP